MSWHWNSACITQTSTPSWTPTRATWKSSTLGALLVCATALTCFNIMQ